MTFVNQKPWISKRIKYIQNIRKKKKCSICKDYGVTHLLLECGCECLCKKCTKKIRKKCPLCKKLLYNEHGKKWNIMSLIEALIPDGIENVWEKVYGKK